MSFNPIDPERMIIDTSSDISKDYTTTLMRDYSIDLNFHEYKDKDYYKIFISKSKDQLFFPKFFNSQSNYKCLFDTEFDKFILILQNIRPDLIYLNESIQIHIRDNKLNDLNDIYIPKINILIENKKLPRLIIVPINILYYTPGRVSGHKNVIIINNILDTITYFEPYGINFNTKDIITFNILKKYYTTILPSYTFINAASGNYSKNSMDKDFYVNDIYDNYYIKIKEYQNHLSDIKLSFSEKEYKSEKNKIKNKIKKLRKYIKNIKNNSTNNTTNMLVDNYPNIMTNYGPQKIQEFIEIFGQDGIGGHCVGWSLYIVFLTFININLFTEKFNGSISLSSFINNLFIQKLHNESLSSQVLSNMIRHFIEYVHTFNEHYKDFILTKSKSSKVVNIKFNTQGGFTVVPPTPIYDKIDSSSMNLHN